MKKLYNIKINIENTRESKINYMRSRGFQARLWKINKYQILIIVKTNYHLTWAKERSCEAKWGVCVRNREWWWARRALSMPRGIALTITCGMRHIEYTNGNQASNALTIKRESINVILPSKPIELPKYQKPKLKFISKQAFYVVKFTTRRCTAERERAWYGELWALACGESKAQWNYIPAVIKK